jgi:hypothetical protein
MMPDSFHINKRFVCCYNKAWSGLVAIGLVILSMGLISQDDSNELITFMDDDGIHLRWSGHHHSDLKGYKVYRMTEGEDEWICLTPEPITMVSEQHQIQGILDYQATVYYALFGRDTIAGDIGPDEFSETHYSERDRWHFQSICLVNPKFGEVLGQVYLDKTARPGVSYQYKITVLTDIEKDHVLSDNLEYQMEFVPEVTGLTTTPGHHRVDLQWNRDRELLHDRQLVSYNIYRSEQVGGPFARINDYNQVSEIMNED